MRFCHRRGVVGGGVVSGQKRYRSRSIRDISGDIALDCVSLAAVSLIALPGDAAISRVLADLGGRLHADRAWMFEYDADLARFRNTHEWCARGIRSHVEDLQDAPVSMIGWLQRSLLAGKAVMIDDVSTLPPAASALRREMLRQLDRSVLSVPVFHGSRLRACIGFDTVRELREWSDAEAAILAVCGRMIAEARYGAPDVRRLARQDSAPLVYIGHGGTIRGIPFDQIVGIRSQRNDTMVWLDDGSVIVDRRPLAAWRDLLPQARFPSIHRTAIVNLNHVSGLDKHAGAGFHWQVRLRIVEDDWPVSRQHRKTVVERLGL